MINDYQVRVTPRQAAEKMQILQQLAISGQLKSKDVNDMRIIRRSIDARKRQVMVNLTVRIASGDDKQVLPDMETPQYHNVSESDTTVVIVGAGPAGLFAALRALTLGIRPIVIERGEDVDARRLTLARISREGIVDPETNYSFGEGGAGAYSDGKLYTRSKKRGNVKSVLSMFCHHGASEDILIDAHPHIGSDKLPGIIKSMREQIIAMGGEVHFNTRVERLLIEDDRAVGVVDSHGKEYRGDAVILATGHSARDTYRMLDASPVAIEPKGLAIGVRLEHPQQLIDKIQYHSPEGRGKYLPAAEYVFVTQVNGRGVYSFCMCPGGVIVPAATGKNQLVVNGMSASARSGRWANSGMVVEIHPEDFPEYEKYGNLCLMHLQEDLEKRFFEDASNTLNAPAQRMTDFVNSRPSKSLPRSSYPPGIHPARIDKILPESIAHRLQQGLLKFGEMSRGFLSPEAVLVGLESRTSSPVRIVRDRDTLCSVTVKNLYPAGEGAGYAGGIVSAAVDGMRCIEQFAAAKGLIERNLD